ncbi:hypothetical protein ACQSSU_20760 [Micromonospora echinospora]
MPAPDEWTLAYPGRTLTFGTYASGVMLAKEVAVGPVELFTDDAQRPRGDGRAFGVDYRGASTLTFEMHVLGADEAQARSRLTDLALAWRADVVRRTPGAVAELSTVRAGRPRVLYGRPRRFAPAGEYARQGHLAVVADFAAVDDCWYGPVEHQVLVPIVPPPSGGLVAPLVTPLTTVPAVQVPESITVEGDLPAWPVITVYGPITGPVVQVTGLWSLGLAVTLPADQALVIDTRPWRRTVLRASDGASFAGTLARTGARLSEASVPAGTWEVVLRGQDVSGTARMRFAWRNTYAGW